ncbi:MAG: AEC family transporter, partial [Alphaproteobacteria bacterium]|nr:AEC family transporter [Alphaproteobacteria bacterium]
MIAELFAIIAPVFFGAAVGYGWARTGQPYDTELITRLLVNVTTPCLVFSRISTLELPASEFAAVAGAAGLALVSFAVLGFLAVRLLSLNMPTSLPPIVFPNCGNMGLPLCL